MGSPIRAGPRLAAVETTSLPSGPVEPRWVPRGLYLISASWACPHFSAVEPLSSQTLAPAQLSWCPRGFYMDSPTRACPRLAAFFGDSAPGLPRWDPRRYCRSSQSWACPRCVRICPRISEVGPTASLSGQPILSMPMLRPRGTNVDLLGSARAPISHGVPV